ncbi:hydroxylase [Alteromonas sp. KUL49]|uniref:VOC family protein n=1 Tax=Alteromonas sp. KUL49 TaxID=2480798 RepID=UPI0010FFC46A|nr:hydroxylase [Alteromonas sp. KUL49]GEA12936.1 hypothetical protein KUL49_33110 [Alteromonas sp. KUL49]
MTDAITIHYLEIVTPEAEQVCASYSDALMCEFSAPEPALGNARIAKLNSGGMLGIRLPMHDAEDPVSRPYYLVEDIEKAVTVASQSGAEVIVPPMDIPGFGKCSIVTYGNIQSGFWQV